MKTNYSIWILGVLTAMLTCECRANLNGSDDFNDNSKDTNRWGADSIFSGGGIFTEVNQRLEYITSGTVNPDDLIARPWVLNSGSSTQNWEVQIDLHVLSPSFALTNGQQVFLGLIAFAGDLNNRFLIQFGKEFTDGFTNDFKAAFGANGVGFPYVHARTGTTFAALRIAFDANSKVLSCFYDANGADCGYSWTLLRADEVGTNWGLTSTSAITVAVLGQDNLTALVSSNNVFADNFCASSGATPRLGITAGNSKVIISWPTNGPACHLESASTLTPPICWQVATNTPGIVSTNFTVTNTISSGNEFYRLSR